MPVPDYGAAPLAKTFLLTRGISLICMIPIVGLTANFVAEIVGSSYEVPREVVGTLVVACLAALYCLISVPFFYARANLGLLIMTAADLCLLLAFVLVAVFLGQPLSFLNCMVVANVDAAANAQTISTFTQSLGANLGQNGSRLALGDWAGSTRTNCLETKAIWGLSIAMCVLFFTSSIILPTLWFKARRAAPTKSVV